MMEINGDLVKRLAKQAEDGEGDWQTSDVPGTFRLLLKAGSIRVRTRQNESEDTISIVFEIYNSKGRLVDEFTDDDLSALLSKPNNIDSWYQLSRRIFDNSRRRAMKTDQVIKDLIAELDLDADIPF